MCLPDCYSMRFTTQSNYHLIEWLVMQCLFISWIDYRFLLQRFHPITLVLQANRLTKCASHPIGILSSQFCFITSKTTLDKNILAQCWPRVQSMFSQENKLYIQCCLDLPEPTLYKKITFTMLAHSPQTALHRKIVYNFVWIYLG